MASPAPVLRRMVTVLAACTVTAAILGPPSNASADGCSGGTAVDFDGDGVQDLVVGDPDATVDENRRAGRITVIYGGDQGPTLLERGTDAVPGDPGEGDRFGEVLDTFDHDGDGCTDLVVGLPYEEVDGREEAGAVLIVHGSPQGLGEGTRTQVWNQDTTGFGGAPEAGDWFGHAIAAGNAPDGDAYAVIGVPGESIGDIEDAGYVQYVRGEHTSSFHQNNDSVSGTAEVNDRYGFDVAASDTLIAVGSPGESIGDEEFAGGVHLFNHEQAGDRPEYVGDLHQDADLPGGVNGTSEAGDRTGTSVDVIDYRADDGVTETMVAIGSPGEDLEADETDVGGVHVFSSTPEGTRRQIFAVGRNTGGMDLAQSSDFLGQHVRLVDTTPGENATDTSIKLVAGTPGHTIGDARAAGLVQVFHPLTGAVDERIDLDRSEHESLGDPVAGGHFGMSFHTTADELYLATPFDSGDPGAVHAVSWSDLDGGTPEWRTWCPGQGGIPEGGKAFGAALR